MMEKEGCPMMGEMYGHMKGMTGGEAGEVATDEHQKHYPSGE
jgi:hypothetical protein